MGDSLEAGHYVLKSKLISTDGDQEGVVIRVSKSHVVVHWQSSLGLFEPTHKRQPS